MKTIDTQKRKKTSVRPETFSNGLEITASHVRLGDQTWAVHQIKRVGIGRAASGEGMVIYGFLFLALGAISLISLVEGAAVFAIILLVITAWCGYGVYSSWDGFNSAQVWLQTGALPVFVFKSRDIEEAQRVKQILEKAIARHMPN